MGTDDPGEQELSVQDVAALMQGIGTAETPSIACTYFLGTLAADSSDHDHTLAFRHAYVCDYCRPRVVSFYPTPDEATRGTV